MTEFWQDINTVPPGTWVLVTVAGFSRGYYEIAAFVDGYWVKRENGKITELNTSPTHYALIEDPPQYEEIT